MQASNLDSNGHGASFPWEGLMGALTDTLSNNSTVATLAPIPTSLPSIAVSIEPTQGTYATASSSSLQQPVNNQSSEDAWPHSHHVSRRHAVLSADSLAPAHSPRSNSTQGVPTAAASNGRQEQQDSQATATPQLQAIIQQLNNLRRRAAGNTIAPTLRNAAAAVTPTTQTTDEESTASAAERHRLTSQQGVDQQAIQALGVWAEQALPFSLLFVAVFLWQHIRAVTVLAIITSASIRTNTNLRKHVAKKQLAFDWELLASALYVILHTVLVHFITQGWSMWQFLTPELAPLQHPTIPQALFTILTADGLCRLWGTIPKLLILAVHQGPRATPRNLKQQGRVLTCIEYIVACIRSLFAPLVWYKYLIHIVPASAVFVSAFTGTYLALKALHIGNRAKLLLVSAKMAFRRGAVYGSYAKSEDIQESGNQCPVCQDAVEKGVKLSCGHIFCEDCISEWLERDHTCPMCRSEVKPPSLQSFADGSSQLLPQLF